MRPLCHRNGSLVGSPVAAFGVPSVYDEPVIWPRWFCAFTRVSPPPSVPRSVITPFCQANPRVSVPHPKMENGSGVPSEDIPAACPRSLIAIAKLS